MPPASPYLNREEQALREVGQTTVRPVVAWILTAAFLISIYVPALIQHSHDVRSHLAGARSSMWPQCYDIVRRAPAVFATFTKTPGLPPARVFAANRQLLKDMRSFEDALEDESIVGQKIRPAIQYALARWLGSGNEKAYCGRYPWLFYRADVDYLTGPGFLNPVQLARRAA
ncbi:MAG: hypothetical protein HYV36_06980, partial [Lentisphaerae bacterium]|nr:hypothetical protein [Lentisphaerota bacterium]